MQLRSGILLAVFSVASTLSAQDRDWFKKGAFTKTQVNILSSYYEQDGNHSPVTGGIGTEKLTDVTPTIIVNIPLDSARQISGNFGVDFYTSASTDNINDRTSASRRDSRAHGNITYTQRLPYRRETFSVTGGLSTEYDVNSVSFGGSWSKESANGNSEFSLSGLAYLDTWKLYRPQEFRQNGLGRGNETDNRNTYSGALTFSQVMTPRLQALVSAEFVYQQGMLSTPFHRVFFDDGIDVSELTERQLINSNKARALETLPDKRLKIPFGIRANYYLNDFILLRGQYRFYWDDFGIVGNTFSLEAPMKLTPFIAFIPTYRHHTQTASKYFKPFGVHQEGAAEFFTSDYDLANISSNQFGAGLRISPVYGIGRLKLPFSKGLLVFKNLDIRYSRYYRSDGLDASIIGFDLGFEF